MIIETGTWYNVLIQSSEEAKKVVTYLEGEGYVGREGEYLRWTEYRPYLTFRKRSNFSNAHIQEYFFISSERRSSQDINLKVRDLIKEEIKEIDGFFKILVNEKSITISDGEDVITISRKQKDDLIKQLQEIE